MSLSRQTPIAHHKVSAHEVSSRTCCVHPDTGQLEMALNSTSYMIQWYDHQPHQHCVLNSRVLAQMMVLGTARLINTAARPQLNTAAGPQLSVTMK